MASRFAFLLGLLLLVGGCPSGVLSPVEEPAVAILGGQEIPRADLLLGLRAATAPGEIPKDGAGFESLRSRVANELFIEEVLIREAAGRGLSVTAEQLAAELTVRLGDPPNPEARAAAIERLGSEGAFYGLVRRRLLARQVEAMLRAELAEGVQVTPEQVEAAKERFEDALVKAPRVRARQIFSNDPEIARALHARIVGGEQFVAVSTAEFGGDGDMGWMTTDAAPTLLLEATRDLAPSQSTEVLRSPLGYHIFQLVARRPALRMGAAPASEEVERRLLAETVESRLNAWVGAKTDELGLQVQQDVVDALRCCKDGDVYVTESEETQ
jgi:peptidyl-prolyl cis-trans isomerase C